MIIVLMPFRHVIIITTVISIAMIILIMFVMMMVIISVLIYFITMLFLRISMQKAFGDLALSLIFSMAGAISAARRPSPVTK